MVVRFRCFGFILLLAVAASAAALTDEQETVEVTGVVRTTDGRPVSGVSVIINYSSGRGRWSGFPALEGKMKAASDARGRFKFVLPKSFRSSGISVETPPESRMRLWSMTPPGRFLEMWTRSSDKPVTVDIRMKTGSLALSGKVATESGTPVKGAVVTIKRGAGMGRGGGQSIDATTDAQGVYRFRYLLPGNYSVDSVIPERGSGLVPMKRSWRAHKGVRVPEVRVGRGDFILEKSCSIRGRVLDEAAKPVEGARVTASLAPAAIDGPRLYQRTGNFSDSVTTDAAGRYELEALSPETYQIMVKSPDGRDLAPSHPLTGLKLEVGRTVSCGDIVLVAGGSLEGTVRGADGKPVHGVTVKYGERSTRTDARGRYRFAGLPTGALDVKLVPPEGSAWAAQTTQRVPCMAKLRLLRDWSLEKGGRVYGVVKGEDGKPIAGANIYANFMGYRYSTVTDKAGWYQLTGLVQNEGVDYKKRPRLYELGISTPADSRYMSAGTKFGILLGEELTRDITLKIGGTIEGEVKTTDGKPIPDVRIDVFKKIGRGGRSYFGGAGPGPGPGMRTDADGRFTVRKIPSGSFTVSAITREDVNFLRASRGNLRVTGGEVTKVLLTLKPGGEISGTVTDAGGKPILGARVSLVSRATGRRRSWGRRIRPVDTDERGRYKFAGLPTGTYELKVTVHDGKHIVRPQDVMVEAGSRTVPNIRALKGAFIEVKIKGPGGEPVTQASVRAECGTRGTRGFGRVFGRVDKSGLAVIGPLLPGAYTVQVSPRRTKAKALEQTTLTGITVKEGQRVKRSVKLEEYVKSKLTPQELERRRQENRKGGPIAPGKGG